MGITKTPVVRPPREPVPPPPPPPEPRDPPARTVVVGTQPATLAKAGTARQINIYNPNDQPIFLGLGAASTDTGFPVQAGGYASLDWSSEMDLVAVAVDDLPIAVRVLEVDAFGNA